MSQSPSEPLAMNPSAPVSQELWSAELRGLRRIMVETKHTFCRICEPLCGLEVDVEAGRVLAIRPDRDHLATAGFACIKGLRQHELYGSPDRLTQPLKRTGGRFEPVSWDRALAEIGATVRRLRAEAHPDSVGMYVGTAAGFSLLHPVFAQGFMTGVGSRSMYSSASQDCSNKFAVAHHLYGFPFIQPFPDLLHTECLILVGTDPVVSQWSFLAAPQPKRQLRELVARGGKLYVVDPRRTETARAAGTHVAIRPGTDVFFYLSFLQELTATGGIDRARLARHTTGFERVAQLCEDWPAERTAEVTRIAPPLLRQMVADYRTARGAALYCSTGVNLGGQGSLAFWLQEVINAASGNLDRRGGTLVGKGIVDFPRLAARRGLLMRSDRSRVGDLPSVNDAFPGGVLADEILTPGARQVRALFVTGGNPLLTMPASGRLRDAFDRLELLVVLDVLRNETAERAHFVLPTTAPLERPDLLFAFPLLLGLQQRPYLQATEALLPPPGQARDESSIYLALARACGTPMFGSAVAQWALERAPSVAAALDRAATRRGRKGRSPAGPAGAFQRLLLDLTLRAAGQPSFRRLAERVHGMPLSEHQPGDFLGQRVLTADGRVQLAPVVLLERAKVLVGLFQQEQGSAQRLKLVGRRTRTTHNSWTHNLERFVEAEGAANPLVISSEDAKRLGLADGAVADVTSASGRVRVAVQVSDEVSAGTVALGHGWGHQGAPGLSVASATAGVNVNLLAPDGPSSLDRPSGNALLNGIPVEVRLAAGPPDHRSWSGCPSTDEPAGRSRP
ncbi:MAG: molybdopterin-dependent oxidoreductase [Deltaproteobacteria bacterium]|nr:molybdopterin-dependent oxidoreductase [Deltaproteobacteria bacterium]MBW2531531.1 molybdopterin-dependent oxidoreductase [Deltaproteobacteria bacterium]